MFLPSSNPSSSATAFHAFFFTSFRWNSLCPLSKRTVYFCTEIDIVVEIPYWKFSFRVHWKILRSPTPTHTPRCIQKLLFCSFSLRISLESSVTVLYFLLLNIFSLVCLSWREFLVMFSLMKFVKFSVIP